MSSVKGLRSPRNRKRLAIIAALLLTAGLVVWRTLGKKEEKPQLQTARVERGLIVVSVSASGQIVSSGMMDVTTQASGVVKKVYVQNGQAVKKGDKILELDLDQSGQQKNAQAYSSYLSARNSLESAKVTQYTLQADMFGKWDTFKKLAESDAYGDKHPENRSLPEYHIPENNWLASEAKYKNQQAVINQAQLALNSAWLSHQLSSPVVVAPTAGNIVGLAVVEGMVINGSSSDSSTSSRRVAVVQTAGAPIASFNLSEIDVTQVTSGQKATVTLDGLQAKTFTGKVASVDQVGTVTSGVTQYPAILRFDSQAAEILPNMAATANIIIATKDNVLLVPSSAVQDQGGQNLVRVLKDDRQQLVRVEVGLASDTQTEVISGLNEGDMVITSAVSSNNFSAGGAGSPFGRTPGVGGMMRIVH